MSKRFVCLKKQNNKMIKELVFVLICDEHVEWENRNGQKGDCLENEEKRGESDTGQFDMLQRAECVG